MSRDVLREVIAFLVLGLAAFLGISVLSQDDTWDYLDGTARAHNLCGPAGAVASHYVVLWLGRAGAFGLSVVFVLAGLTLFFRRRIGDWGWKLLGVGIALLALASFEVAVHDSWRSLDTLPGGFLGQFAYMTLFSQLSSVGTYLLLIIGALVAFLISTDTMVYPAVERAQRAVLSPERWRRMASALRSHAPSPPRLSFAGLARFSTAVGGLAQRLRARPGKPAEPVLRTSGAAKTVKEPPADPAAATATTAATRAAAPSTPRAILPAESSPAAAEPRKKAPEPPQTDVSTGPGLTIRLPSPDPAPAPAAPRPALAGRKKSDYRLPPLDFLKPAPLEVRGEDRVVLEQTASRIEHTLATFKIEARVVEVQRGPTITQFEVSLAEGIKVNSVTNLSDDLAMALKAQSIRIVAPIPGKSTIGIEVPNKNRNMVGLRELIEFVRAHDDGFRLPLSLGRDTAGSPIIGDLQEMPHLLIAGSTGSGKSVCINSVIATILMTRSPDEVKLILVDPKMVELAQFENIPHLLSPVVTDMKKAPAVLNWLVDKMEERYETLAAAGVRHITSFNALGRDKLRERLAGKLDENEIEAFPHHMPFVVVIIDELADLMMQSSKEVESSITRLSQKSRAVGIHVILATQRPSVDVITGLIKANMPSRISFRVASRVDSRTILDRNGAEKLLGKGDMLYLPPGTSEAVRVQGTFISDREIREVVEFVAQEAEPQFNPELTRFGVEGAAGGADEDELFDEAVRIVLGSGRGSVTLLQRQLQIGYTRASRLMEMMHERGLVGPFKGSKAREVYYTLEEWEISRAREKTQGNDGD